MHKNNGKSPESSVIHRAHMENRKASRQRSYARAQKKKEANRLANEERRKDNDAILVGLGLTRTTTTIEVFDRESGKLRKKVRPDSPQRTARLNGVPADLRFMAFGG